VIAKPEKRLQWTIKDVGAENNLVERPWLQLMCYILVSSHEVGCVFQSKGSHQDRGPKWASGGVREDEV